MRLLTELRAKHQTEEGFYYGIDGNKGKIEDMRIIGVWEPYLVKSQVLKTAIESSCMLLRIDDVLSGIKKSQPQQASTNFDEEPMETFGDARDG